MSRAAFFSVAMLIATLVAGPVAAGPDHYTVRRGDTLTAIAKRFSVRVKDLRTWNGLRRDHLKVGQVLDLKPQDRMYRVRRGDTLGKIARREGTTVAQLEALNPGLTAKNLRAGQEIAVYLRDGAARRPSKTTKKKKNAALKKNAGAKKSKGQRATPRPGAVTCPHQLLKVPRHIGYKRVHRDAAWATAKALDAIDRGFDQLLRRHRLAPRVHLLDASRHDLAPVGNHRSHQDGRDVDITYYQRKCPRDGCPTRVVTPKRLDVKRQWSLLHYWLRRGDVEMMFIDHDLQKVLYAEAKRRGASKAELGRWFQYPLPAGTRSGVIRHWPGHRNHVHVRFKSPVGKRRPCPDAASKTKPSRRKKRR
ncbi:MAG: LysM peptidoglycan-binding domain-containing protein [Myxococcota bacterium]